MNYKDLQKAEIQRLGNKLSFETLIKIQIRIQTIRLYFGHLEKFKKFIPKNEYDLVYRVYFTTIAVLYRSLFKGLDREIKININCFINEDDKNLMNNHLSLINIVDKDIAHLDKRSKSHKVIQVQFFKKVRSTTVVTSQISEDELIKTINFLNLVLEPAIQEATSIAKEKQTKSDFSN